MTTAPTIEKAPPAGVGHSGRPSRARYLLSPILRQRGLLLAIIMLVVIFSLLTPSFLSSNNILNIVVQGSVTAILAIGQMFVIITSGIDLSIGSMLALGSMVAGTLLVAGIPIVVAVIAGLLAGAVAGTVNGLLATKLGITPFIVTLGTMSLFGGLAFLISDGKILYTLPQGFLDTFAGRIAGIPVPVWVLAVVTIVGMIVLKYTKFGEYLIAIGGNQEVARLAGIKVSLYVTAAYALAGILAVIGGLLLIARLGSADPVVGTDLMLPAIAAAVMGGAALRGGEGSVGGAVLGAMLISALQSGLTLINVQAFYQQLALGAVILIALILDRVQRTSKRRTPKATA
jgi:ribose transport system permease protein